MVLATFPFSVRSRQSATASAGVSSRGSFRISSASMHHLPQPCFFCSCSVSRSTYLLLTWPLTGLYRARFKAQCARLTCSAFAPKRTQQKYTLVPPWRSFSVSPFRRSGKTATGVWVLPRQNAFGYPNAMLAKSVTRRERCFCRDASVHHLI